MERKVDIEIYSKYGDGEWAQARYLVHGITDVMWTDDLDEALSFLKAEIEADRS